MNIWIIFIIIIIIVIILIYYFFNRDLSPKNVKANMEGGEINVTWDTVEPNTYVINVNNEKGEGIYANVDKNNYKFKPTLSGRYEISVARRIGPKVIDYSKPIYINI